MTEWLLFTDGSVNTQTMKGCGAALLIEKENQRETADQHRTRIKTRRFADTSSTKLELQTLLWALQGVPPSCATLTVYTDSQNILSLTDRRADFETQNYCSKKGIPLGNAALYQAFFKIADARQFKLIKVIGHLPTGQRDIIDHLFNLVDKASRAACKKLNRI